MCDLNANSRGVEDDSSLVPINTTDSKILPCVMKLKWNSKKACPACSEDDYIGVTGSCQSGGKQDKIYFWKEPRKCVSSKVALPEPESIDCDEAVLSKSTIIGLGVGGTIAAIALVTAIVWLLRRKTRLYEENMRLRNYAQLDGDGPVPDIVRMSAVNSHDNL